MQLWMEINVVTLHKVVDNNGTANALRNQSKRRSFANIKVCDFVFGRAERIDTQTSTITSADPQQLVWRNGSRYEMALQIHSSLCGAMTAGTRWCCRSTVACVAQ